ncbi:hypothetical protein CCP4SC76_1970003 [Gammaproteobacteria bacterium]
MLSIKNNVLIINYVIVLIVFISYSVFSRSDDSLNPKKFSGTPVATIPENNRLNDKFYKQLENEGSMQELKNIVQKAMSGDIDAQITVGIMHKNDTINNKIML